MTENTKDLDRFLRALRSGPDHIHPGEGPKTRNILTDTHPHRLQISPDDDLLQNRHLEAKSERALEERRLEAEAAFANKALSDEASGVHTAKHYLQQILAIEEPQEQTSEPPRPPAGMEGTTDRPGTRDQALQRAKDDGFTLATDVSSGMTQSLRGLSSELWTQRDPSDTNWSYDSERHRVQHHGEDTYLLDHRTLTSASRPGDLHTVFEQAKGKVLEFRLPGQQYGRGVSTDDLCKAKFDSKEKYFLNEANQVVRARDGAIVLVPLRTIETSVEDPGTLRQALLDAQKAGILSMHGKDGPQKIEDLLQAAPETVSAYYYDRKSRRIRSIDDRSADVYVADKWCESSPDHPKPIDVVLQDAEKRFGTPANAGDKTKGTYVSPNLSEGHNTREAARIIRDLERTSGMQLVGYVDPDSGDVMDAVTRQPLLKRHEPPPPDVQPGPEAKPAYEWPARDAYDHR